MSDIPEDIRAAAEALAADWFVEDAADWVDGILAEKLARDIARALLAERNATEARIADILKDPSGSARQLATWRHQC